MEKQSLFISYCWKDGNVYADELESQLRDEFEVRRDKTQLIANDDLYDFMADIAKCDNVIIVLTAEYVKSLNCMLEMSYLVEQDDWSMKSMVLVIDNSLYSTERKLEVITYWFIKQKMLDKELSESDGGKTILEEEKNYVDAVCSQVEKFLKGISRRKNPSQISVVNEIKKRSNRNRNIEFGIVESGEKYIQKFLKENGSMTIKELSEATGRSMASTSRLVSSLIDKGVLEKEGNDRRCITIKR